MKLENWQSQSTFIVYSSGSQTGGHKMDPGGAQFFLGQSNIRKDHQANKLMFQHCVMVLGVLKAGLTTKQFETGIQKKATHRHSGSTTRR